MRSALAFLTGLLFGACTGPSAPAATPSQPSEITLTPEAIAQQARAVTVIVRDGMGMCSGVWIARDAVLTADHCYKGLIATVEDDIGVVHLAVARARDDFHDLLVLRVLGVHDHEVARLSLRPLRIGERVHTMGHPVALTYTFSSGNVSADRTLKGVRYVQATTPATHGNSGGGLFDSRGDLVGIAHGYVPPNAAALNLFIHPEHCEALLAAR
jgi:S1-C subfamily serine protease